MNGKLLYNPPAMRKVIAILLTVLAYAPGAHATSARSVSLLGSPLVPDDTDLFLYPGAMGFHRDLVVLDLGVDPFTGDGGILIGLGRFTIGAWAHRTDSFEAEAGIPPDLEEMMSLYSTGGTPLQFQIPARLFDLLFAAEIMRGVHVGLDLFLSHSFWRDRDGSGDTSVLSGENAFTIGSVLGLSARRASFRNDVSFELAWNYVRDVTSDVLAARTGPNPCFSISDRLIVGEGHRLGWGLFALLTRREYGIEMPAAGERWGGSRWIFRVGGGPRVEVFPYLVATLEIFSQADLTLLDPLWEPPEDDADGEPGPTNWQRWNVLVPGVRIAAEVRPATWVRLRAAVEDQYRLNWQDDTNSMTTNNLFTWSLGLGFAYKGFAFDAAVAQELFLRGPYIITGNTSGFLSSVSVSYEW